MERTTVFQAERPRLAVADRQHRSQDQYTISTHRSTARQHLSLSHHPWLPGFHSVTVSWPRCILDQDRLNSAAAPTPPLVPLEPVWDVPSPMCCANMPLSREMRFCSYHYWAQRKKATSHSSLNASLDPTLNHPTLSVWRKALSNDTKKQSIELSLVSSVLANTGSTVRCNELRIGS